MRRDPIGRTCQLIRMFQNGSTLTNKDIRNEFGVSKSAARNLITGISLHFPLFEMGTRAENPTGPESIIYGLLKGKPGVISTGPNKKS